MNPSGIGPHRAIERLPGSAVSRLHDLVRQRDTLRATFYGVWDAIAPSTAARELEAWSAAVLDLADVNAGPACLIAFWRLTVTEAGEIPLPSLAAAAHAAAEICRHAGAPAALAAIDARALASRSLRRQTDDEATWWRTFERLAREAPTCVAPVAARSAMVIEACGVVGFASFVAAGLRSAGAGTPRRLAFFTLDDLVARSLLERLSAQVLFGTLERSLGIYTAALWGARPVMHVATPRQDAPAPRRVSIAGGIIRVPEGFRGVPVEVAPSLFRAAIAHATAHLALGDGRFRPGGLKPVQLALVGLIEDARVEALAMRRFPGLRRLFAPFHVAEPVGVSTAPALLARLARALFDPDYRDDSGFIAKGRTLFAAELERLDDADLSRRIGGLLGNDLGQMRIQFNAKTYVVEPAYRDDGLGLWDFTTPPDVSPEDIEVPVEAVRVDRRDNGDRPDRHHDEPEPNGDAAGRAHAAPADDLGTAVATYPEWDRAAGIERADWTTIRDVPPIYGDAATIEAALARETSLRRRIERLVRGAKVGRTVRLRRQEDGVDLDLDAALDAAVALRAGEMPADRIHRTIAPKTRDLTTLILIDMSESTRERAAPSGATVLDVEKAAVALLAQAMERLGDPFALRAFASNGRDEVRLVRLSEFGEDFDAGAKARLAGLRSGLSTRLGAALRHAGAELAPVRAYRKIVLALTDGEPADIDVGDPLDLIEDARRAVRGLKARGIDVFGITLDPAGQGSGTAVFGRTNHMPVCRIEELPARLSELYFRLARR